MNYWPRDGAEKILRLNDNIFKGCDYSVVVSITVAVVEVTSLEFCARPP